MTDVDTRFHEQWLGMVQPVEGLVVSVPVLVEAQCISRHGSSLQPALLELCPLVSGTDTRAIADLPAFFAGILGHEPAAFDTDAAIPADVSLFVPEGGQTLRPSYGLKHVPPPAVTAPQGTDATPAAIAAAPYVALVWDLPDGLDLDRPETETGPWVYPPAAKFDRLLRHCRVPIGLLTNRRVVRLVYAPHGESSGAITFRIDDMATVGGRPMLEAFVMLLSSARFFDVAPEHALPAILAESRKRQANVTNELADQVLEAIHLLLRGFESAAERDGDAILREAVSRGDDHVYGGLLTVLLRLVFVLYAEDRGLLPVDHTLYAENLSALALFARLQTEHGAFPDSMARRYGAWPRLVSLFRAIYLGVTHGDLRMPARRGDLFDPERYPFLEGWGTSGAAPVGDPQARAQVHVPTVDDETVFRVLEKLLVFQGQRLSYRTLDVEQIGSVYEALMGYHVLRVEHESVCLRPGRVWVSAEEVFAEAPARRGKWLQENAGLAKGAAEKLAAKVTDAKGVPAARDVLAESRVRGSDVAKPGRLVLQPGSERRRTSSHYTPRSLSAPIVRRTLEPLLAVMGERPASERILHLKVCDPAMGSGAFLVEACRFLGDQVVAAWTREGVLEQMTRAFEDPVMHARRLVAQRCLYGVDKNPFAVSLAKLSLWLVTLAKGLPFTFLDHALRHGDSLVGLDFEQIKSAHWKPSKQLELARKELEAQLDQAIVARQRILALAEDESPGAQKEKESALWDANDAVDRVRLIADVVVGAFFAKDKDKEREKERVRRVARVEAWLRDGGAPTEELREMQREARARVPMFHWMVEFPEVFYAERPDPLDGEQVNRAAFMDAFVGNPPFAGGRTIRALVGDAYTEWLDAMHGGGMNVDLSARFFTRAADLLGSNGTIGLIATNTIAQGDTRAGGLQKLVADGFVIYDATESMPWPGDAAVTVSVVHLAIGTVKSAVGPKGLDGARVAEINSRLGEGAERADAAVLLANANLSFQGSVVLGMGFTLTPDERAALVRRSPRNAERIFPYLGGEEINTSPTQNFDRYVINFGQMKLAEAERWPDLIAIVRQKVKPERDKVKDEGGRKNWWQHLRTRPEMYGAIARLKRCLVTSRHSKHLCFAFQPTDRVFSEATNVFAFERATPFAVLQSRIHAPWAHLLSSSIKADLRYTASDCFETFPFPQSDPSADLPDVETIGERLHTTRASYMIDENVGLTITYTRLKDPALTEVNIVELRALHEELDRAVLDAYGWVDMEVPPYCAMSPADEKRAEVFGAAVIDRLFARNAKRAEEERVLGSGAQGGPGRNIAADAKTKPSRTKRTRKDDNDPSGLPSLPGVK